VRAESAGLGQGASFSFELPLARLADPRGVPGRDGADTQALSGRSVLVVDDDFDARLVLTAMLRQNGAKVVAAESVQNALGLLGSERFDAIVTDIAMPGEDGFALIRLVRETSAIPMVAVSAIGAVEDANHVLAAGFSEFVRKPVDPPDLAAAVLRAVTAV
jgi:CheY-like chemotaxis protein